MRVNCPSGIDVHELNAFARSYIYDQILQRARAGFDSLWTVLVCLGHPASYYGELRKPDYNH